MAVLAVAALVAVVVEVDKNHVLRVCTTVALRSMAVAPSHNQALNLDLTLAPQHQFFFFSP
jgi:hypothetical protein